MEGGKQGCAFPRSKRLLNASDYSRVFEQPDAKAPHRSLLLLARHNDADNHRLGLVIAKKNVRLAVGRNRIKRLAREFFRALPAADCTVDVVLLTRRGIDQLDNAEVSTILQQQWQKLSRQFPKPEPDTSRDR